MNFIDIHSHILPGMDDGAKDIEISLEMAQVAAKDGIRLIVATPHVRSGKYEHSQEEIIKRVAELNHYLGANNIKIMVLPGAEYYLEPSLPQRLADGEILTINDTGRFLLVELSAIMVPEYTERVLYEIQLQGTTPIIAHPERNQILAKHPEMLYAFSQRGILAQVTSTSITGLFGRSVAQVARRFLSDGSVQVMASDGHTPNHRAPLMYDAYCAVKRLWGVQYARRVGWENPAHIVKGQPVEIFRPLKRAGFFEAMQRPFRNGTN